MPIRLLLVEDEALIALSESRLLEKHGYQVVTAKSGEEAIAVCTTNPEIALILMDIDLGRGMDGTVAARHILELRELPIVFLTSHAEREYVERVKQITNYGYVLKTSGEFVLIESINMAFSLFEANRNLKREIEERRHSEDELKRNEESLRQSESRYRSIFNNSAISLWEEDISAARRRISELRAEGISDLRSYLNDNPEQVFELARDINVLDVNGATLQLYEAESKEEILGSLDKTLYSVDETRRFLTEEIIAIAENRKSVQGEMKTRTLKGRIRDIRMHIYFSPETEQDNVLLLAIDDITTLKAAVQEKNVFMQELNHRVKNNLQLIQSLISLKSDALNDTVDLSDIIHEIDAIRLVHENLNRSDYVTRIYLPEYIAELVHAIFASYTSQTMQVELQIDEITLNTDTAIPLGLIINEITTNAIKYGFSDGRTGSFGIELHATAEHYTLRASNSGAPFPEEIDLDNPDTLGLRLITALVSQLDGTIGLQRAPHPVFTFTFPIDETVNH